MILFGIIEIVSPGNITEKMRIDSSGRVGLGTTAPADFLLHVHRGNAGTDPTWEGTSARNLALFETDNAEGYVNIFAPANATTGFGFGSPSPGNKFQGGMLYSGASAGNSLRMYAAQSEIMRISGSGNVGIGESAPDTKLHISDSGIDKDLIKLEGAISADEDWLGIVWRKIDSRRYARIAGGSHTYAPDYGMIKFEVSDSSDTLVEKMRIEGNSGYVGIGTTSPARTLDIVGNMQISSSTAIGSTTSSLHVEGSGSEVFAVDGTLGRMFTVSDEMSGSIFSANTISGTPVIEATSTHEVYLNPYNNGDGVGIGTTAPSAPLQIRTDFASGTNAYLFQVSSNNDNEFIVNGDDRYYLFNTWQSSWSDKRLKKNITPLTNGLDICNKLNPITFNWKKEWTEGNGGLSDRKYHGVIAQEIQKVVPELVYESKDKLLVQRDELQWILLSAVKNLSEKVEDLQNEINELKGS